MKYQKPINSIQNSDEFSFNLMEAYGKWMGGDCFQNTEPVDLHFQEAFMYMDPQSHGAEIEKTTTKKKTAKKETPKAQLATKEDYEVLEREEYEIDGQIYVLEKVKMDGKDDNGFKTCWKGYKKQGTKIKGGKEVNNCVKAGYEAEGDEDLQEKVKMDGKDKAKKDPCWKGYEMIGMKKKGGREVPNCVKAGYEMEGDEDLQEKAPPGAKYERMVKHIKKGYSKDGLSDKEKSIAYATAWKAKGKKEEYDVEAAEALWAVVGEALAELGEMDGAKFKVIGEKLDPVGKEDNDIDNDGDHDKSDKYLHARRKKIGKILAMKGEK